VKQVVHAPLQKISENQQYHQLSPDRYFGHQPELAWTGQVPQIENAVHAMYGPICPNRKHQPKVMTVKKQVENILQELGAKHLLATSPRKNALENQTDPTDHKKPKKVTLNVPKIIEHRHLKLKGH
jgi:hypothetical protein